MSDDERPWDWQDPLARYIGETRRANDALRDYWLMGPGRSLRKLLDCYCRQIESETDTREPPTRRGATLFLWSSKYRWQARIDRAKEILDDEIAKLELEARVTEILGSGYALHHERVAGLKALADLLGQEMYEESKRWLPDVKQIGSGEQAERIDIVRFNAPLIEQFRRTLDDIAAELGQRIRGVDVTSAGKAVQIVVGGVDLDDV